MKWDFLQDCVRVPAGTFHVSQFVCFDMCLCFVFHEIVVPPLNLFGQLPVIVKFPHIHTGLCLCVLVRSSSFMCVFCSCTQFVLTTACSKLLLDCCDSLLTFVIYCLFVFVPFCVPYPCSGFCVGLGSVLLAWFCSCFHFIRAKLFCSLLPFVSCSWVLSCES